MFLFIILFSFKEREKKKKKVDFFLKLNFFFKKFKQTFLFRKVIYIEIFLKLWVRDRVVILHPVPVEKFVGL